MLRFQLTIAVKLITTFIFHFMNLMLTLSCPFEWLKMAPKMKMRDSSRDSAPSLLVSKIGSSSLPSARVALLLLLLLTCYVSYAHSQDISYLLYQQDFSDSHTWQGNCDSTCCTVDAPCRFNNNEQMHLTNITSAGCTYQLVSASESLPMLDLNSSSVPIGANITFLVEPGFSPWAAFSIYQEGASFTFGSAVPGTKGTLGGVGYLTTNPYYTLNYTSKPAFTFNDLNLVDLAFSFSTDVWDGSMSLDSRSSAALNIAFSRCNISSSAGAYQTLITMSSYASPSADIKPMGPSITLQATIQQSTIVLGSDPTVGSFFSALTPPGTQWRQSNVYLTTLDTSIRGSAKSLFRLTHDTVDDGPSSQWTLMNTSTFDLRLSLLVEDTAGDGTTATMRFIASDSSLAFLPYSEGKSLPTFFSGNSYFGTTRSNLSGVLLPGSVAVATDSSIWTNVVFSLTSYAWTVSGMNTIQYIDSASPTPSQTSTPFVSNMTSTAFAFVNSDGTPIELHLLTSQSSTGSFLFSGNLVAPLQGPTCLFHADEPLELLSGALFNFQCNLTLAGGIYTAPGELSSTILFQPGTVVQGASLEASLSVGASESAVLSNVLLNLTGFSTLHVPVSSPSRNPFISVSGGGYILGYPYKGLVIDWGVENDEPIPTQTYVAFYANATSIRSAPFDEPTVTDMATSAYDFDVHVRQFKVGISTMWNVTFERQNAMPIEAPSSTQPPTVAACPTPPVGFVCSGGVWVSNGSIEQSTTVITVTTASVVVNGNFSVGSVVFTGTGHTITVNGCVNINGSIGIDLTGENIDKLNGKTITFVTQSSGCSSSLQDVPVTIAQQRNSCKTASSKNAPSSSRESLTLLFAIDRSNCDKKWIILGAVLGGVVLLGVIITVVIAVYLKSKGKEDARRSLKRAEL